MLKKFFKKIFPSSEESLARLAEKNYKQYKKWLNNHAPTYASGKIELRRVRTSKAGVNYYVPKDLLQLTVERKEKIAEYQSALGFGMTKQEMIELLEGCIDHNKKQAYAFGSKNEKLHQRLNSKLQVDLADAVVRMKTINSSDVMLRIALLFFFVDNEDPYTINDETQKRKYQEAQDDDALRAFFLQTTQLLLKESEKSE